MLNVYFNATNKGGEMNTKGKLVKILGAKNVIDDASLVDKYARDISLVNATAPSYVVKPHNAEELQKLVKMANETMTPLVAVSSGFPHFRGDTIPASGGAVIVDLSGMKRIIRVDRYHRVAMVEVGVTFEELIPQATKEGIRLNMPLLPKKAKSVVGSLLDREPVVMPKYQWDISDPVACLGVVFGTGDEFRTGQAAGPGTLEEQWAAGAVQKAPYGPGQVGWHRLFQGAQGTMGIVTWASMRCELLPSLEEPFIVGDSSLSRLFELTQWLVRRRLVNECFILNSTNLAAIFAQKWPKDYLKLKNKLPAWIVFFNLAGYEYYPEERIAYQIKDITSITQRLGLEAVKEVGGISANEILKAVQQPSNELYWKLRCKGASEDIFFLTIYDKLESQIRTMFEIGEKAGYPAADTGVYIQPVVQGTSCHCEFNLYYDPENPVEVEKMKELSGTAIQGLMNQGAFFSRPHGENAKMIINRDAASVIALKKIKKILDPNNILNPGKLCF
jgi:FAD/FMN-containing dehydrogenase